MPRGARGRKRFGPGIRTREAQHLMARVNELWNNGRTDKAGSSGHKNTHILFSFRIDEPSQICYKRREPPHTRLSEVASGCKFFFFLDDCETFPIDRPKAARGCAAESRTPSGGCE